LTLDQAQWEAAGRRLPLNDVKMLDLTKQARQDKEGRNGTWWLCFVVKRFIEWRRKGGGGKGSKVASDVPVAVQGRVMLLNLAEFGFILECFSILAP
jgi:hypothetical protein